MSWLECLHVPALASQWVLTLPLVWVGPIGPKSRLQIDCSAMCEDATSHLVRAECLVAKGVRLVIHSHHSFSKTGVHFFILGNSALAVLSSGHAGLDTSHVHCKSRQRSVHPDRELPIQECALALRRHLPQHQQHGRVKRRMRRAWTSRPK